MVVHAYYPIGEPRVEREAKAAARAGFAVDVVCLRQHGEAQDEEVDGIEVHRLPITHDRGAGFLRMIIEYLRFALRSTVATARLAFRHRAAAERIVQVHAPPDFLIVAGIAPKLLGSKLIFDIHDLSTHLYRARFARHKLLSPIASSVLTMFERAACGLASEVITVHEPYRTELISHGIPGSRVTVVMNAVDENLLGNLRSGGDARNRDVAAPSNCLVPDGDSDGFLLAYHGTITPSYGVDLLVEALPQILEDRPDTSCLILGHGDALPSLWERAKELGVDERVEFSGRYLPIADVLGQVAHADCGVIPNRPSELNRFALSSKLFEYVELGIPAVVARLETLARHFAPEEVTFFEPGDVGALVRAIEWVARNPLEARAKAARARERYREYSWPAQRERYLRLLGASRTNTYSLHPSPPASVFNLESEKPRRL